MSESNTTAIGKAHPLPDKQRKRSKSIQSISEMTEEEQRLHRNAEILRMMPDNIADALAKARYKPIWCSDVRWRMELARRRKFRMGF